MAIARASGQTVSKGESSSATSVAAVFPQAVVAGNFIAACGGYRAVFVSMADNLGNTYDTDVNFNFAAGDREVVITSCKKIATGGSCTVTHTQDAAGRISVFAEEYSGFGGGGAQLDDTATKNEEANVTSMETNIATLAGSEGLGIMCIMDAFDGVPYTYGSSFSVLAESGDTLARSSSGDRVLSAAGDYEGTATASGTGVFYIAALALYSPVPAGPGANAPKKRSRGFKLQQTNDDDDEGHFNELDIRNWWREMVPA